MHDKFTERVRKVIYLAREEAESVLGELRLGVQCRCDSEFDPSSTARRPVRSIARRVAAPSVSISAREASE